MVFTASATAATSISIGNKMQMMTFNRPLHGFFARG
jgi:hypothetical protein